MTPPAPSDAGSPAPPLAEFVRALPWGISLGGLVTLTPILVVPDVLVLIAHLPTYVVLLAHAIDLARRVRKGQMVSTVTIAGLVGGLVPSLALMGFLGIGMLEDGTVAIFYLASWMFLPIVALVGSALAAAAFGVGRCVFRRGSNV